MRPKLPELRGIIHNSDINALKEYASRHPDYYKLFLGAAHQYPHHLCYAAAVSNFVFFRSLVDDLLKNQGIQSRVLTDPYAFYYQGSQVMSFHAYLVHYAAVNSDIKILKYLVEEKRCDINGKDFFHRTPLMHSILAGNRASFQYLIEHPDVDVFSKSKTDKKTALDFVLFEETRADDALKRDMISELWKRNTFNIVSSANKDGGCYKLFQKFIDLGVDVNLQDKEGMTFLHLAAENDCEKTVRYLLEEGADLTLTNNNNVRADELKSKSRFSANPLRAIKQKVYNALYEGPGFFRGTLEKHSDKVLEKSLNNNTWWTLSLDNIATDNRIRTFAGAAIAGGNLGLLEKILASMGDDSLQKNYINHYDLLSRAIVFGRDDIILYLLVKGADVTKQPDIECPYNESYLHLAVDFCSGLINSRTLKKETIRALINSGADLHVKHPISQSYDELVHQRYFKSNRTNKNHVRAIVGELSQAVEERNYETIKEYVLKNTGWLNLPGLSLLSRAIHEQSTELLEVIYNSLPEATREQEMAEFINSDCLLHRAARHGGLECFLWFLGHGGDLEKVSPNNKESVLVHAAYGGSLDIIKYLVENNLCFKMLNVPDEGPRCFNVPLEWASNRGHGDVVDFLLQAGAKVRLPSEIDKRSKTGIGRVLKDKIKLINALVTSEGFKFLEPLLKRGEFPSNLYQHLRAIPKDLWNCNKFLNNPKALHVLRHVDREQLRKVEGLLTGTFEDAGSGIRQHNEQISNYMSLLKRSQGLPDTFSSDFETILLNFAAVRKILRIHEKKTLLRTTKKIAPTELITSKELKGKKYSLADLKKLEVLSEETDTLLGTLGVNIENQIKSKQDLLISKIDALNKAMVDTQYSLYLPIMPLETSLSQRAKKKIKDESLEAVPSLLNALLSDTVSYHEHGEIYFTVGEMPSVADIDEIISLVDYVLNAIKNHTQHREQSFLALEQKRKEAELQNKLTARAGTISGMLNTHHLTTSFEEATKALLEARLTRQQEEEAQQKAAEERSEAEAREQAEYEVRTKAEALQQEQERVAAEEAGEEQRRQAEIDSLSDEIRQFVAVPKATEALQRQSAQESRLSKKIQAAIKRIKKALAYDIGDDLCKEYQSMFDELTESYAAAEKNITSLENYLSEFEEFERKNIKTYIERRTERTQIRKICGKINAEWEAHKDLLDEDFPAEISDNNLTAEDAYAKFNIAVLKDCREKYETILERIYARKADVEELEANRAEITKRQSEAKRQKEETTKQKSARKSHDNPAPPILETDVPQGVSATSVLKQDYQAAIDSSDSSYESSSDEDEREPSIPQRVSAASVQKQGHQAAIGSSRYESLLDEGGRAPSIPQRVSAAPVLQQDTDNSSYESSSDEDEEESPPIPVEGPKQLSHLEEADKVFTTQPDSKLASQPGSLKKLASYVRRLFKRKKPADPVVPESKASRREPLPRRASHDGKAWQIGAPAIIKWCEAYRIGVIDKLVACIDKHYYSINGSVPMGLFAQHGGISPKEEVQLNSLRKWIDEEKKHFEALTKNYNREGDYKYYLDLCNWVDSFKKSFNQEMQALHRAGKMSLVPNNPHEAKELIDSPSIVEESFHGREKGSGSFWRGVKRFFRSIKLKWKNRKIKKPLDQIYSSPRKLIAALNRVEIAESQQIGDRVICPIEQLETIHQLKKYAGKKKSAQEKNRSSSTQLSKMVKRSLSSTAETKPEEARERRRIAEPRKQNSAFRFVGCLSEQQRQGIERKQQGRGIRPFGRNKAEKGSKNSTYSSALFGTPLKLPRENGPATCPRTDGLPSDLASFFSS